MGRIEMKTVRRLAGAMLALMVSFYTTGWVVAAEPTAGIEQLAGTIESTFREAVASEGDAYTAARQKFLSTPDADRYAANARREGGDWRTTLQAEILQAWQNRPEAMGTVYDAIHAWDTMPVLMDRDGSRHVVTPWEPFEGKEREITLAALETLWKLRATTPQFHRKEQVYALFFHLAYTRDKSSTPLLIDFASNTTEEKWVREYALEAAVDVGDTSAVDPLAALARSDPDPDIRRWAVAALGDTEWLDVIPILEGIANSDPDEVVRSTAELMIDYIQIYNDL
jgi:hypothetical protein